MSTVNARVSWPAAPLTASLVQGALKKITIPVSYAQTNDCPLLQWSTYDEIDHERSHFNNGAVLSSSYIFRKALIRKHYLSRTIHSFLTKYPSSVLSDATPRTYEIEISFADELEEMWTDELWELGNELSSGNSWWILKPGMADRGMGIRLFHTKEDLQQIFESFEDDSDESDDDERNDGSATGVLTSQLRHFVIQEYIMNPLLLDPSETLNKGASPQELAARKFHLRVYCLAVGDIRVYLYNRILALFSSAPYVTPLSDQDAFSLDLTPHLTNTSLQIQCGDDNVRLLDELVGCRILSGESNAILRSSDIDAIVIQMRDVLADTFKAALQNPVHFQVLPNAFELFGVDFLVSHAPSYTSCPFQTKLLEINSEPAIELTGPRLTWILEDLFDSIAETCVTPFFTEKGDLTAAEPWVVGEVRQHLVKCLDEQVRGP
ncbi:tubulin-tyrosine ligase [Phlegmacium glaucopus]|nr:tubulin-tyrosine ligase [Phlegmacium glaucopus]